MTRKPDFERLQTALLRQGEPDYVPLFDFSVADHIMSQCLGRTVRDPGRIAITLVPPPPELAVKFVPAFVDFHRAAGYDFVPIRFGVGGQVLSALAQQPTIPRPSNTDNNTHRRDWATENGLKAFIRSWSDLESFPWPAPGTVDLRVFEAASQCLPDGMRLIAHAGGMLMHTRSYMGMERFWLTLAENKPLAVGLLEKLQELEYVAIDQATDCRTVGALLLDDDLAHCSGPLESPVFLREHVFPFYRRVGEMIHAKGLIFILHTDGNVLRVLPDLIDCGFDALQPIEPKAMDIGQLKRDFGDRLALIGNVDVNTLAAGTPEQVREETRHRIAEIAPGGGFAIGSSNSVPDYALPENYRALIDASLAYGRYPISIE